VQPLFAGPLGVLDAVDVAVQLYLEKSNLPGTIRPDGVAYAILGDEKRELQLAQMGFSPSALVQYQVKSRIWQSVRPGSFYHPKPEGADCGQPIFCRFKSNPTIKNLLGDTMSFCYNGERFHSSGEDVFSRALFDGKLPHDWTPLTDVQIAMHKASLDLLRQSGGVPIQNGFGGFYPFVVLERRVNDPSAASSSSGSSGKALTYSARRLGRYPTYSVMAKVDPTSLDFRLRVGQQR